MKDQVLELLPEINQIVDNDLRAKVIACWAEAMEYRDWKVEELQAIPFTLLAENVKIKFIEHVRTCTKMAIAVDKVLDEAYGNRKTKVNRDVLIAGSLLADVGKLLEFDKEGDGQVYKSDYGKHIRHPFSGVGLAFKHGIPSEVMHVIAVHSKEGGGEKRSPEAIIFHHVDFIDFDLVK
jgi:23S rRNA maturation-related 3'-5' exoribonuclease YhaM